MRLDAFLRTIYLPSRIRLSKTYAADLAATVRMFSDHVGRDAMLADLTTEFISAFLTDYASRWSARSTNGKRQSLLCLARAAYDRMLLAELPRERLIRRLPCHTKPPRAWTVEQIGTLLNACRDVQGSVGDVLAADWWLALFATAYWTGCRVGALLTAKSCDYSNGTLLVGNQKNGQDQLYRLPDSCCELIDATDPQSRNLIFDWPHGRRWLFRSARRIIEQAGLPCPREARQMFHCLRRSNLSYCAAVDPAIAQRQANHSDYRTTAAHYVDQRIARQLSAADIIPDPLQSISQRRPLLRIYA